MVSQYAEIGPYILSVVRDENGVVTLSREFPPDTPKDAEGWIDTARLEKVSLVGFHRCNICGRYFPQAEMMDANSDRHFYIDRPCASCGDRRRKADKESAEFERMAASPYDGVGHRKY